MKDLIFYIKKFLPAYIFAVSCLLLAIVLDMFSPQIVKIIVNEVFVGGDFSRFAWLLAGLMGIGLGRAVLSYYKEFTFDKNCVSIGTEIRKDIFNHIQTLSMGYFDDTNTGEIMARVKDDVDKVWNGVGMCAMLLIECTVHLTMVVYCMFRLSWKLTFIPLAFMIVGVGLGFVLEKKFDKVYTDLSDEDAELTSVAEENLSGVRTVKAFAREKFEIEKFLSHNKKYYEIQMREAGLMATFFPVYQFIGLMLPLVCAIIGGIMVINKEMDLGSLVAYVEYSRNCTWPLDMIGELANQLSSAIASYKKLKKISDEEATIIESEDAKHISDIKGNIEFDNVSFSIGDVDILKDISFSLEQGKTLGVMGATGSGKSSLINMLQRFYDPKSGAVKIDGVDIKEMELSQVRTTSAVVLQDVFLFSDTIAENIKMGAKNEISTDEIKDAARKAQASDFIERLDDEYETVIGERGVGLSGGQRQRISIARALSKHAPVLVFDDSTSALDMETEHEIQKELNQITDSSKIIIAHRISAVRRADEIIYLEDGKIAERGTHEELLKKKGLYYNTYVCQYGEVS